MKIKIYNHFLFPKRKIESYIKKFPDTDYAIDLKFKLDLVINQLAAKELSIARYYIKNEKWIPAINRLKIIVEDYDKTIFVEEALHRLVEIYYKIGLEDEAKNAAVLLGYNYNSSEWYEKSYKILNKDYDPINIKKDNEDESLIKRTIKKILFIDEKSGKIKNLYKEKVKKLFDFNKAYFEKDNPIISDFEFDLLKKELVQLAKKYPFLKKVENLDNLVGFKPSAKFEKVKHSKPMLSLGNAFKKQRYAGF